MAASPVRVGIVGAGLMGRWHADAARHAGSEIVGVADADMAAAGRLAGRHPGARVFGSAEALFAESGAEAVHLCTPLETHAALAAAALEAGLHVLVEKPLAPDAETTEGLQSLAASAGRVLCPVHQFLFQDGVRAAGRLLAEAGPIVAVDASFFSAGGGSGDGRRLDAVVADILPHPLSLLDALLPNPVDPDDWMAVHPAAGELLGVAHAGVAPISVRISLSGRPTRAEMRLVGTRGTVFLDLYHGFAASEPGAVSRARKVLHPFDESIRRIGAAGANLTRRAVRREPAYPGLRPLVAAFHAAVRGGPTPIEPDTVLRQARARDRLIALAGLIPPGS